MYLNKPIRAIEVNKTGVKVRGYIAVYPNPDLPTCSIKVCYADGTTALYEGDDADAALRALKRQTGC